MVEKKVKKTQKKAPLQEVEPVVQEVVDMPAVADEQEAAPKQAPYANCIGGLLKSTRERTGKSTKQVSLDLRIRRVYIEAIEENKYEDLPGSAYEIGFVRTYADYLGLDSEEVVRRFKEEIKLSKTELNMRTAEDETAVPRFGLVFAGIIVCIVAYAFWYWNNVNVDIANQVEVPPSQMTNADNNATSDNTAEVSVIDATIQNGNPIEDTVEIKSGDYVEPKQAEAVVEGSNLVDVVKNEATKTTVDTVKTPEATIAKPVEAQKAIEVAPTPVEPEKKEAVATESKVYGTQYKADSRVMIKANMEAWVEVADESQKYLTNVMKEGDVFYAPANVSSLVLTTGNAGGFDIFVDGKKVAPIGGKGIVKRKVPVDAESLLKREN